jgi:hypothetical protein
LIVVPRPIAVVLLLLANVGLRRVSRLCLSLCRLAGGLGVSVGVVRVCARRISVSTSVLVTRIVGIGEVWIVGLGGGFVGNSR